MKIPNFFSLNFWKYYYFRLMRQSGTPEYIARGVAIGLTIGLVLPFGIQLIVAIPLAFLLKASKVLACIFTFVTNNFTIIFIYPVQCLIGSYLIFRPLSIKTVNEAVRDLLKHQEYSTLLRLGWDLVASFFAGGVFLAVLFAVPGYFITLFAVRKFRMRRAARIAKEIKYD